MKCPNCGRDNARDARSCDSCATPLVDDSAVAQPKKKERVSKWKVIVAIAVVAVVVLVIVISVPVKITVKILSVELHDYTVTLDGEVIISSVAGGIAGPVNTMWLTVGVGHHEIVVLEAAPSAEFQRTVMAWPIVGADVEFTLSEF